MFNFKYESILQIIKLPLAVILIFSGILKLIDLNSFTEILAKQNLIPSILQTPFTLFLCMFEILLGSFLILGIAEFYTDFAVMLTFTGFTLLHIIVYIMDKNLSCGCYGSVIDSYLSSITSMFLTGVLWLFSLCIFIRQFIRTKNKKFSTGVIVSKYRIILLLLIIFAALNVSLFINTDQMREKRELMKSGKYKPD